MYASVKALCSTPERNIILCVNYISVKKRKNCYLSVCWEDWLKSLKCALYMYKPAYDVRYIVMVFFPKLCIFFLIIEVGII